MLHIGQIDNWISLQWKYFVYIYLDCQCWCFWRASTSTGRSLHTGPKKGRCCTSHFRKFKSTDLQNQFWSLQSEMNGRLSELQQESVSTATLNAMVKNKTEEIETLKQRLNSILTGNSEVAVTISGLTDTVLVTKSRLDEQMSTIEGLTSELEGQKMELSSLKESYVRNKKALERHRQEVMDIKWVTFGALRDHRLILSSITGL